MTNEEMIKALRICANQTCCDNCPRYDIDHTQDAQRCCIELINDAADALEAAEKRTAELMPKEGEWMPVGDGTIYVKCSVCGEEMCCRGHYCPNCGADMRGDKR